jgi:hypothetical protein
MASSPRSDRPQSDRTLADRVAAVERALTDGDGPPTTDAAPDANASPTGVDDAVEARVSADRVEALEADLADLRASVEALRGVVGDLDRRRDGSSPTDPADGSPTPNDRVTSGDTDGPDDPDGPSLGPLRTPAGETLTLEDPTADGADAPDGSTPTASTGAPDTDEDDPAPADDGDDTVTGGVVDRVADAF